MKNYSVKEVRGLVESYAELREAKGVSGGGLLILCKLADLDIAIRKMPPKEYHAVLIHGQLRNTVRDAEVILGVSRSTLYDRYEAGLVWIANYLNGGMRN